MLSIKHFSNVFLYKTNIKHFVTFGEYTVIIVKHASTFNTYSCSPGNSHIPDGNIKRNRMDY